jgi:hypothetical protein
VPHGDDFRDATLALVGDGVGESLDRAAFEPALALVQAAARLKLRHRRALDGDLLLDKFFGPAFANAPAVPRDRWFEVLVACERLDIPHEPPHVDVSRKTPPLRHPDVIESYVIAELAWADQPVEENRDKYSAAMKAVLDSAETGPRVRAMAIVGLAWFLPGEQQPAEVEKALALDPENPFRNEELGMCLDTAGRNKEALERFRQAHELWRVQSPRPFFRTQLGPDCEERIRKLTAKLEAAEKR